MKASTGKWLVLGLGMLAAIGAVGGMILFSPNQEPLPRNLPPLTPLAEIPALKPSLPKAASPRSATKNSA